MTRDAVSPNNLLVRLADSVPYVVIGLMVLVVFERSRRGPTAPDAMPQLQMRELVTRLEQELQATEAQRLSEGVPPMFQLKSADVEVNFAVVKSTNTEKKLEYRVVTLSESTELRSEQVHKLVLHLDVAAPVQHRISPNGDER